MTYLKKINAVENIENKEEEMKKIFYKIIYFICFLFLFLGHDFTLPHGNFSGISNAIGLTYVDTEETRIYSFTPDDFYVSSTYRLMEPHTSIRIYEHELCYKISNLSDRQMFIPTNSLTELQSYVPVSSSNLLVLPCAVTEGQGCSELPDSQITSFPCIWNTKNQCHKQNINTTIGSYGKSVLCGKYSNLSTIIAKDGSVCSGLSNSCWKTDWVYLGNKGYMLSDLPDTCADIFTCPVAGKYTTDP